jgi:hypothetical protein
VCFKYPRLSGCDRQRNKALNDELRVNFKTGRFINADFSGYWALTDERSKSMGLFLSSTVTGGTCTKIE